MEAITREEKIISGENLTPITRKEMFLAKASGQNVQTPTPITREEYFLSKITGGGGSPAVVEGTAIPVGVEVEKIYINTNNTLEQTKAYLSQLTYVQTPFFAVPIYPIFACVGDGEEGLYLFVAKYDTYYELLGVSSLEQEMVCVIYTNVDREEIQYSRTEGIYGKYYSVDGVSCYDILHHLPIDGVTSLTDFNGLPVGAENEKIKNVLSITPFTGGTSSNEPTAYTVSSVDELPSDAVDGSMAIVETIPIVAITFNRNLTDIPQELWNKSIYFDFYCQTKGGNFCRMNEISIWEGDGFSFYGADGGAIEEVYVVGDGWYIHNYIYFVNMPKDNEFLEWVNNNGDYFEPDIKWESLYTRKNGKWVYKCEVA